MLTDRMGRQGRAGGGGCGRLLVLALLLLPIQQLQPVFRWSDEPTVVVELMLCTLFWIGASHRQSAARGRPAGTTPGIAITSAGRQAQGATLGIVEASSTISDHHTDRIRRQTGQRPDLEPVRRSLSPGRSAQRWERRRDDFSASRPQTLPGRRTGKARDPLPAQMRFGILQRDGFRCRYCGRPGSAPGVVLHVDHVVPVAVGGATTKDNLLTACEECNLGKAARALAPAGT
jgi:5-methylcytosine-specific restriction endonuclease McrA